jgi:hypothetical protein
MKVCESWQAPSGLRFAAHKSFFLAKTKNPHQATVNLNGADIQQVSRVKYLGLQQLREDKRILLNKQRMEAALTKSCRLARSLGPYSGCSIIISSRLLVSMMRGSALYGSEIFDVAPITLIKQFGKVAKLLLGGYRSDSPSAAVEFLGWDPICWARITRVKFAVRMLAHSSTRKRRVLKELLVGRLRSIPSGEQGGEGAPLPCISWLLESLSHAEKATFLAIVRSADGFGGKLAKQWLSSLKSAVELNEVLAAAPQHAQALWAFKRGYFAPRMWVGDKLCGPAACDLCKTESGSTLLHLVTVCTDPKPAAIRARANAAFRRFILANISKYDREVLTEAQNFCDAEAPVRTARRLIEVFSPDTDGCPPLELRSKKVGRLTAVGTKYKRLLACFCSDFHKLARATYFESLGDDD